ncbi:MAG: uracil-DNA glycosylase [Myxococcales bacterium]|nr:uracil-DNA glycosylase [Myxococcales bacterium]
MTTLSAKTSKANPKLPSSWLEVIGPVFDHPPLKSLKNFLVEERAAHRVFPPGRDMFNAFWMTDFKDVRVVIIGQDPYHGEGQAHGLCFSVRRGCKIPPSLENIFKEIHEDIGTPRPQHGELTHWAKQGVLLLNTVLSVRAGMANSHRGHGWEYLTDQVINELNQRRDRLVFVLWGSAAGRKASMIDGRKHLILRSPHPSPLSAHRGFFGCRHFSQINTYLTRIETSPIDWSIPDD